MDSRELKEHGEYKRRIAAGSRSEVRDGKYIRWRTPLGEYWAPDGPADLLTILLT